jgi:hypothetical protein
MADDNQRQNYGKTSKVESTGSLAGAKGGGGSSGTGPTGSSRSYPKGKGSPHNTNWNPMKSAASTYGICGV